MPTTLITGAELQAPDVSDAASIGRVPRRSRAGPSIS
jgi:hypothetical protein